MTAPTPGRPVAPPLVAPSALGPAKPSATLAAAMPEVDSMFTTGDEQKKGYFVNVAGPPKYGKTTFAAGAPDPAFIVTDRNGLESLPRWIKRRTPDTWHDFMSSLLALRDKAHTHRTVVIDTVFKAEALLIKHLCVRDGKDSLRKVGGGYGAGYDMMVSEINQVIDILFTLNARGIHTIAISQVEHKTVKDASLDDYEKTALALSKQTALVWTAAADVNMFVQPEMKERDRIEAKDKEDRVKVEFTGRAICHVRPTAGIEAGNRLFLESPITYSWAALEIGARAGEELRDKLFAKLAKLSPIDRAAADWRLNQDGWSTKAALAEINN